MNMPNNQLKLNLKGSGSGKIAENEVFEKATGEEPAKKSLKRKLEDHDSLRQQQKLASMKSKIDAISKSADKIKTEKSGDEIKKKLLKAAAAAGVGVGDEGGADAKNRREELLKQLRAVEEAIHRKRSKLDQLNEQDLAQDTEFNDD